MQTKTIGIFGEVLFDQFPEGQALLGGAPFNVAWHLQAFGAAPCFISRVGDDALGEQVRLSMQNWGMAVDKLQTDNEHPTGTVAVSFNNGEPAYAILAQQAYDFIDAGQLDAAQPYSILYHGTLALRHPVSASALQKLTEHHTGKVFVDVNLRAPWWQVEQISQWLVKADWLKLNHHELAQLAEPSGTIKEQMDWFVQQYRLDVLLVTCGEKGAIAVNNAGEWFEVQPESNLMVADTVGAGDAFSAAVLLGMQRGWALPDIIARAQDFASALVTRQGAVVLDRAFYQPFIESWQLQEEK